MTIIIKILIEVGNITVVFVQSLSELVYWWWDLQTFSKDSLLSLNTDVFWPFDEVS